MMIEQNTNYAYKLKYKPTPALICNAIIAQTTKTCITIGKILEQQDMN